MKKSRETELTVVVPVYNRASIVERTLESVRTQSLRPLRLIVVDNASTDDTAAVVQRWMERNASAGLGLTLLHEPRQGAAAARACGLRAVDSAFVYFLDSDDEMMPDAAASFLRAFKKNPEAGIVFGHMRITDRDGRSRRSGYRHGEMLLNHFHHCVLNTNVYAVRTSLLRSAGGWNPDIRIWDDWELGVRLLLKDPVTIHLPEEVTHRHEQHNSVTGDKYSHRAGLYAPVLEAVRCALRVSDHPEALRLLRLVHGREMMLAALYAREGRPDLAGPLRAKVIADTANDPWLRLLLRFAYSYRRRGLRGVDSIVSALL